MKSSVAAITFPPEADLPDFHAADKPRGLPLPVIAGLDPAIHARDRRF